MGLFRRDWTPPKPEQRTRPLVAAGQRVQLDRPETLRIRRRQWQEAAWEYRDSVPELRFAGGFVAFALGRLRYFAAENQPRDVDPIPLAATDSGSPISAHTQACAIAAVERLDLDARGSSIMARLGENLDVAGEAFLLGEHDPNSPTGESWSVRSVTEVRVDSSGRVTLTEPGGTSMAGTRVLEQGTCELLRVWRSHPQYADWPDNELAACLDVCEELRLYDRALRALGRSRIGSGKLLYIPDEFSLVRAGNAPVRPDVDGVDEDDDQFQDELVAGFITPITDEGDPSAIVPMIVRGPAFVGDQPAKDLMGVVDVGREDPADLIAKRDAAAAKLGRGLNLPPEVVAGLGDTNHWSAWSIDANTCKNHIEPRAEIACDALTMAYLRPMLLEMGCPADEVARIVLWFDPSELVQNPNRGQDARDAHAAGVLSDEALGRTLGFADDDMPSLEERAFRAIVERAISDQQIPLMLALGGMKENHPIMVAAVRAAAAGVAQRAPLDRGPAVVNAPGLPPAPDQPTPAQPMPRRPLPIAAAAEPFTQWRVPERLCAELAQVDATLTATLLAHADATVNRAVERAANRIRSRAVKNPELAAQFRGRDPWDVIRELGEQALDYQDARDMDDALSTFEALFLDSVGAAARRVAELSAQILGVGLDLRLVDVLTLGGSRAWGWLEQQLRRLIQAALYSGPPDSLPGEKVAGVVPASVIRGALAQAGGLPARSAGVTERGTSADQSPLGGLALGDTAGQWRAERGAVDLGYEWQYFGLSRDSFPGHRALSGRRFTSFDDDVLEVRPGDEWIGTHYYCGDHDGCLCGFLPVMAVPMDPQEGRALADAAQTGESRTAEQARVLLAESDDRAGRTGTVAQQQRDARAELARLREIHISERESR